MLLAKRPLWPLASHEGILEVFGEWTEFMTWDWWGIPSSYYFSLTWVVCLLLLNRVIKLRAGRFTKTSLELESKSIPVGASVAKDTEAVMIES